MNLILRTEIKYEQDVVAARQRTRQIAALLGYEISEQTRIAAAVSEIGRNALNFGKGGTVEFFLEENEPRPTFLILVSDRGPGMKNEREALRGAPEEGLSGIQSARRLVDKFDIESAVGKGTRVFLRKYLPRAVLPVTPNVLERISRELSLIRPQNPYEEMQQQNRELMRALEELHRVNNELAETNRGVVALYAELEDKADRLKQADEMKSRFLRNMSHEFRTPVNSTISLARLMLSRTDGPLTEEQEKQVQYMKQAMENLLELINDLLDLAKVEAGKISLTRTGFKLADVFSSLRGMFRPLMVNQSLSLVFEDVNALPELHTDEAKLSQILRNFVSNAVKFTEHGEIRVSARHAGDTVTISVSDTGIGIAPEDQGRIFEEFTQVSNAAQRRNKGTGLGLPLSRRLAELLGGSVHVQSRPGQGSVFSLTIPGFLKLPEDERADREQSAAPLDSRRLPVLVVEDKSEAVFLYRKYLENSGFQVLAAATVVEARRIISQVRPIAIVLDVLLDGTDSWGFLAELKENADTAAIPVIVATVLEEEKKGLALGADDYCVKPVDATWLIERLMQLAPQAPGRANTVLVIDDDEASRYLVRNALKDRSYRLLEAEDGEQGIELAREHRPGAIFLDLTMPGKNGFEVLRELRGYPETERIPVIVLTSKVLDDDERRRLKEHAEEVLSKGAVSYEELAGHLGELLKSRTGRAAPPQERKGP